ncbi:MAG: hypothetical protein F6K03_04770 [Kamptonema sp. SIO4C4]|nr:hypothetical protein [Kamptonema sp. SIO4C4]
MDDWSKAFWEMFEVAATDFEQLCQDMEEAAEAIADEIGQSLIDEFDQFVETVLEPTFIYYEERIIHYESFYEEDSPLPSYRPATPDHHPVCQGCQHYHGQVYNGTLLVCAMHPHGAESSYCPDWESVSSSR